MLDPGLSRLKIIFHFFRTACLASRMRRYSPLLRRGHARRSASTAGPPHPRGALGIGKAQPRLREGRGKEPTTCSERARRPGWVGWQRRGAAPPAPTTGVRLLPVGASDRDGERAGAWGARLGHGRSFGARRVVGQRCSRLLPAFAAF